ncbi:MAG: hypothetical protein ACJ75B_00955 [Flavisolibacter sp.]|jgi:CheY-like chemotaxis protein
MYFIYVSTDTTAVESLEKVLRRLDQHKSLLSVDSGYDLIEFLQNVKEGESYPDLIILSTNDSRLNGCELLELLKTDDIYRMIPVVMLFHEQNKKNQEFCDQMGTEYIPAPGLQTEWMYAAERMCAACV